MYRQTDIGLAIENYKPYYGHEQLDVGRHNQPVRRYPIDSQTQEAGETIRREATQSLFDIPVEKLSVLRMTLLRRLIEADIGAILMSYHPRQQVSEVEEFLKEQAKQREYCDVI